MYIADPYIPHTNLTKKKYVDVDADVDSLLRDEDKATITNIDIRNDILAKTGHDICAAGNRSAEYDSIHDEMVSGDIDREEAREKIGAVFADNERPSTAPDKTYREYYAKTYEDHYDENNK